MAQITIGEHTYGTLIALGGTRGKISIGKYCSIAYGAKAFMGKDHNMDVISTYPFTHIGMPITKLITKPPLPTTQRLSTRQQNIVIGNDVWIGQEAIIFRGVTIGDGACIGAFSSVTKDIPPYSVVVGHSRIVRTRFSAEDVEFLLKLRWWDLEDQVVADIAPILHTPDVNLLRQWAKDNAYN